MNGLDLLEAEEWSLSGIVGYEHSLLTINAPTVINTWIILCILLILLLPMRWLIRNNKSIIRFLVFSFMRFFMDMVNQALNTFSFTHFSFITALFCFIFFCNIISFIPGLEEPTADLNTAMSLGIVSFLYTQAATIYQNGLWAYIKGYFSPFFIMFPLNIVSKLASIVSVSFRLFGNIFGGAIISTIYFGALQGSVLFQIFGILTGINLIIILFFTLFEGFLQAFVFTTLSITYLAIALQGEGH